MPLPIDKLFPRQTLPTFELNPARLLSRDEVERLYGIPKRFLEIAACKGGGPLFVKVGRLTRYRVKDVDDWIDNNRFANTSAASKPRGGA